MTQRLLIGLIGIALFAGIGQAQGLPKYKVDPFWPKDLSNNWIFGHITGMAVDSSDHIWVLSDPASVPRDDAGAAQNPPWSKCCIPAPSVVEFDAEGNVLTYWGALGSEPNLPAEPHGIRLDKKGNVWIGGAIRPWNPDLPKAGTSVDAALVTQVLKFSSDGNLLMKIGASSGTRNNQNTGMLGDPTALAFDDASNEVYIADGLVNKRVVVYDSNTGAFKRGWGAYGEPLSAVVDLRPTGMPSTGSDKRSSSKQFGELTDIAVSDDGFVYVTDQDNNRVQVFTKSGNFVKEFVVAGNTLATGSAWGLTLSNDPKQLYLFVADGASGLIRVLSRQDGTELGTIGHKGRNVGQFANLSFLALDSKGNLYTGEVHFTRSWDGWQAAHTGKVDAPGGRIQKFVTMK